MMLVNIEELYLAYDDLKRMYMRVSKSLEELLKTGTLLAQCTSMEAIQAQIKQNERFLEERLAALGQMLQALERITHLYMQGENKVLRAGEAGSVLKRNTAFGETNLENMVKHLSDVQFG